MIKNLLLITLIIGIAFAQVDYQSEDIVIDIEQIAFDEPIVQDYTVQDNEDGTVTQNDVLDEPKQVQWKKHHKDHHGQKHQQQLNKDGEMEEFYHKKHGKRHERRNHKNQNIDLGEDEIVQSGYYLDAPEYDGEEDQDQEQENIYHNHRRHHKKHIGCVLGVGIFVVILVFCCCKRRKMRKICQERKRLAQMQQQQPQQNVQYIVVTQEQLRQMQMPQQQHLQSNQSMSQEYLGQPLQAQSGIPVQMPMYMNQFPQVVVPAQHQDMNPRYPSLN